MDISFSRTQGLPEAKSFLAQAFASGSFPHGLLIHGPSGLGQNALALDLADILLCEDAARRPCGKCAGCQGVRKENIDTLTFLMPLEKKAKDKEKSASEGDLDGGQVDELAARVKEFRADPYGFARPEKGNLDVAQVRGLQGRLAYAETARKSRVVIILWAEAMAASAANTLLKTLEEPPPGTHFLLACEDRGALLPTIVSRCTQLALFPMAPDALRDVLSAKAAEWDLPTDPGRLLPFAEGSPGALLALHRNGGDTLIAEAGAFFSAAFPARADDAWMGFSDYLEASKSWEDMQSAAPLLEFLLRATRLVHRLRIHSGAPAGAPGAWTRAALEAQGFDASLEEALAPLEPVADLGPLAAWIEELLSAVRDYARPKVAALGLYLEYVQQHPAGRARAA